MENNTSLESFPLILPDEHRYLTFLKKVFRHELRKNGFRRITTPAIESNDLISKIYEDSDSKYSGVEHKDGFLKNYPSIGVMKSYIDNEMREDINPVYFYYVDRFFENIGGEKCEKSLTGGDILGEKDPILDAILVYIVYSVLNKIGLQDSFEIRVNSVGIKKEQDKYREELISFFENKKNVMSENAVKDLEIDPILVFNSDDEDDRIICSQAPSIIKFLKKDSKAHYAGFLEYLKILDVPVVEDNTLFGENHFTTNTVWKISEKNTGRMISRGSRYNSLSAKMGEKKEIPGTGFYVKNRVVIDMMMGKEIEIKNKDKIDLYFVQLGDEAKKVVLPLSLKAREAGINTVVCLGTPSMKDQMLKANKSGANYVVMVGLMEARNGVFQIRNLKDGTQDEVKKEDLIEHVISKIGKDKLDFYSPTNDLII